MSNKQPLLPRQRKRAPFLSDISQGPQIPGDDLDVTDRSVGLDPKRSYGNLNKECYKNQECSNLTEPEFCSSNCIQSLENEFHNLEKEKIVQKPINIYLKNCARFAKQNLHLETLEIESYQFSERDTPFLHPKIIRETEVDPYQFHTKHIKLFTQIIFHDHRQILVVKSWQKVLFQEKLFSQPVIRKNKSQLGLIVPKARQPELEDVSDNSALIELPPGFENDKCFFIKTLQFFDGMGCELCKPILVEQIQGNFSDHMLYDVGICQFQEKIYYFKRKYAQNGTSLLEEAGGVNVDSLQLYSFDLLKNVEAPVQKYFIQEGIRQVNTIFSKQFGEDFGKCPSNEDQFLQSQFVLIQEYMHGGEYRQFQVIQLDNVSREIVKSPNMDTFSRDSDSNRMVQLVHHLQISPDVVYFLVQNMFVVVQVKYDMKQDNNEPIKIFHRNSLDVFQKIWNTTGFSIQKVQLKRTNSHNHLEIFYQYFYIDSRNKVQLVYPNYPLKIDRTQITDMIYDLINIQDFNSKEYKKINLATEIQNDQNIVRNIRDLMQILNYELIQQSHQLTFCQDKKSQKLYMSSPKSNKILIWWLKEHNCVECKQFENIELDIDMLAQKSQAMLEDQNQNSVMTIMKQVQCTLGKRIISANQRLSKANEKNQDNLCGICDYDHVEEYISYQVPLQEIKNQKYSKQDVEIDEKLCEIRIKNEERDNHVFLDDNGVKIKVKTYDRVKEIEDQMQIRLILYQPTQRYECFVFAIFNQDDRIKEESAQNSDQKALVKKSYFFITKNPGQMNEIIKSKAQNPIIGANDTVYLLKSQRTLEKIKIWQIKEYQFKPVDSISYDSAKDSSMIYDDDYRDIKLTFIQVKDIRRNVNFIPFIYQDRSVENNTFLMYDILQESMSDPICINPPKKSLKYIYEDEQGYNCFSLCRTSDVNEEDTKSLKKKFRGYKKQTSKYQLFTLLSEKVGIIMCDEFLITHDYNGSILQLIGKKQIILSKKSQQTYDWSLLKNFKTIPFKDACQSIKGCQLIIQTSKLNYTYINLLDQDQNNLYNYRSQIVLVGQKMFQISNNDSDIYAMVISTVLRKNVITRNIFDKYEIEKILSKSIEISLGMRIPDLEYLILNRFEDLAKKSFFQAQELLQCKSICDISLGDSESINEGVANYRENDDNNLSGSIFDVLTRSDQVRKDMFREIGFAPKILIIQKDLNFTCTIERALYLKQFASAKTILNQALKVINSFDYHDLIMNDLPVILDSKQVTINEFFQITDSQRKDREREGFCNIEINFKDPEVPVFSDKSREYIVANEFDDYHQCEKELAQKILVRDKLKIPTIPKSFVVTHTYVDFRDTILGEKLRGIQRANQPYTKIKFDNRYYANWMQECGQQNLEFYLQESVQKLIDYQWTFTKVIMSNLFAMYVFFFMIPICFTLFTDDERIHATMLNIATIPALILFFIELIQMGNQGFSYFMGWNLIDFFLLVVFSMLQYYFYIGKDHSMQYMPVAKLVLILLSFMKLLFFVRIYEEYGFLVQMILLCVLDLIPFITSYMIFLIVFTVCFVVLKMEIDPEVDEAQHMTYFQKMLLQTFRTAIGELGMPMYGNILAKEESYFKDINIVLIWILWFAFTFFMLVIMLNFLIAVITSTYERVMNYQKIISYMHKAELNVETFQLISFFYTLEEYSFIVFSTSAQAGSLEDDQFSEIVELLKKFIFQDNKDVRLKSDYITKDIQIVLDNQDTLNHKIEDKFKLLSFKQIQIREDLINQLGQQLYK